MLRSKLFAATSLLALAASITTAHAQAPTTVTGGGSTSAEFDYLTELATYNASSPPAQFLNANPSGNPVIYWTSGGGTGQTAFLGDDNTCNSSKVLTGTSTCSGPSGGANAVAYATSDGTLSSTQISSWATLAFGKAVSGNLIQLPSFGVGVSFPIVNSSFKKNGAAALDDNDLCNVFTGGFTDWNQTSIAAKVAAGPITVAFRSDSAGASFLFLNHLTSVCTGANAPAAGVTLAAVTNFATIFPKTQGGIFQTPFVVTGVTYYTPANFVPANGANGVANYLSGQPGPAPISAIGYVSPDYTTLDPLSNAVLADGSKSKLVVAGVVNASNGVAYTPTAKNITVGLNSPLSGQNLSPPTGSNLTNPAAYVPVIQTTKSGYPIIGYSTIDLAQCYGVPSVGASVIAYLKDHYGVAAYKAIQSNNGDASLATTKASGFYTVILNNILSNKTKNNLDIQDKTACAQIGR